MREPASLGNGTRQAGDAAVSPARRLYTGKALERRQAWGKEWGAVGKSIAEQIRREGH